MSKYIDQKSEELYLSFINGNCGYVKDNLKAGSRLLCLQFAQLFPDKDEGLIATINLLKQ